MENHSEYKTGPVAKALKVHENTIRDWSDKYQDLLSPRATSGRRKFTPDDLLLLATINDLRDKGLSFDAIRDALEAGQRIDKAPDVPTAADIQARQKVDIIRIPRDTYILELERYQLRIEALEAEITRLQGELEGTSTGRDTLQVQVTELTGQLEGAKARLEIIQQERPTSRYWLAVIVAIAASAVFITAAIVLIVSGGAGG